MKRSLFLVGLVGAAPACNGTTGYDLVTFYAAGRGFPGAVKGQPFKIAGPVTVTLTKASLHVGALYLTQSVPQAGGGPQPCTLPQTYEGAFVGEVRGEGDVDLLDGSVQGLPVTGDGSTIPSTTGQVWLVHDAALTAGNLNGGDPDPVLTLVGSFEDGTGTHTFSASITINTDRITGATNTGLPGEVQLCQRRIVSGVPAAFDLSQSGTLVLDVDPASLFNGVPFTDLPEAGSVHSGCVAEVTSERCFTNDSSNTSSVALFQNLTSYGPYGFAWRTSPP